MILDTNRPSSLSLRDHSGTPCQLAYTHSVRRFLTAQSLISWLLLVGYLTLPYLSGSPMARFARMIAVLRVATMYLFGSWATPLLHYHPAVGHDDACNWLVLTLPDCGSIPH